MRRRPESGDCLSKVRPRGLFGSLDLLLGDCFGFKTEELDSTNKGDNKSSINDN